MKTISTLLLLMLANFGFGQVEFYIGGQLVDQTVLQEVDLFAQSPSLDHPEFRFMNTANASVSWKMDHCILIDHQNITGLDVEWYHDSEQIGLHFLFGPTSADPCWEMPNGIEAVLLPGEYQRVLPGLEAIGPGCELHRFYIMENTIAIDSIDIMYCTTIGIDENELGFNLSPNPANANITIETDAPISKVQLIDLNGKEVLWKIS